MDNTGDGEIGVFDFDEISNHLLEQGLQASPSELHGCLCGLLGAGASREAEAALAAVEDILGLILHGELADQAMQLYKVTAAALEDEEFDFYPLLPDDSIDVAERTDALGLWCRGFLAGFAHVAASTGSRPVLSADSGEILSDFAKIAQAEADQDASEDELEDSYMELVEYLRFAALNVVMDTLSAAEERSEIQ